MTESPVEASEEEGSEVKNHDHSIAEDDEWGKFLESWQKVSGRGVAFPIIGIGGVARVGKDTFAKFVTEILTFVGTTAQREAFADCLKEDLNPFLLDKTGVNCFTSIQQEKDAIRPLLVEYGKLMRSGTDGKYWISLLSKKVDKNLKNNILTIVTDVRYANEAQWIKNSGGIVVHLHRAGIEPANAEESQNDPLTKNACNFSVNWDTQPLDANLRLQALTILNGTKILPPLTG